MMAGNHPGRAHEVLPRPVPASSTCVSWPFWRMRSGTDRATRAARRNRTCSTRRRAYRCANAHRSETGWRRLQQVAALTVVGQVRLEGARIQQRNSLVTSCRVRAMSGLASRPDQPASQQRRRARQTTSPAHRSSSALRGGDPALQRWGGSRASVLVGGVWWFACHQPGSPRQPRDALTVLHSCALRQACIGAIGMQTHPPEFAVYPT